uniref:Uncharacterized protein n=1 Tax=Planktothrix agardhii TaxID=1160 RepID=A0A1J1JJV1_PLAAG|nr:protein of unknown function [Planktothrix agardhii]
MSLSGLTIDNRKAPCLVYLLLKGVACHLSEGGDENQLQDRLYKPHSS